MTMLPAQSESALRPDGLTAVAGPDDTGSGKPMSLGPNRDG